MRKYNIQIVENRSQSKPIKWVKGNKYPKGTQFIHEVRQGLSNEMSIQEVDSIILAYNVGNMGRHINVNLLEGGSKTENYKESNLLAMDFDSGISIKDALNITKEYNIKATFGYYTFSHNTLKRVKSPRQKCKRKDRMSAKDKTIIDNFIAKVSKHWKQGTQTYRVSNPRFRLIWELPKTLYNPHLWQVFQNVLIEIFDRKVDLSCDDLPRMFFGGKGLIQDGYLAYPDFNNINPINLFIALETHYRNLDIINNTRNCTRDLKKFFSTIGLNCINGHLASIPMKKVEDFQHMENFNVVEYLDQVYLLSKSFSLEKKSRIKQENIKLAKEKALKLDRDKLQSRCELYANLAKNEWLYHHELIILCSNLWNMEGFATDLETNLNTNHNYTNIENKKAIYNQARQGALGVMGCSWKEGCRHYNNCNSWTILDKYYTRKAKVKVLHETELITLEKGREKLSCAMKKINTLADNTCLMIQAEPGIGKSYNTIHKVNLDNTILGSPTHRLATQLNADLLSVEHNKDMKYIQGLNTDNMDDDLQETIDQYYSLGMYKDVFKLLKEEQKELEEALAEGLIKVLPKYYYDILNYFHATENIKNASKILTTHQRIGLGITNKNIDTIIFDEDPIKALVDFYSIKRNSIKLDLLELQSFCRMSIKLSYDKPNKKAQYHKLLKAIETFEEIEARFNNDYIENKKCIWFNNPFVDVRFPPWFLKALRTYLKVNKKSVNTNLFRLFKAQYITTRGNILYTLNHRFDALQEYNNIVVLSATIDREIHEPLFKKYLPHLNIEFRSIGSIEHKGNVICYNGLANSRDSLTNQTKKQKQIMLNNLRFNLDKVDNVISFKDDNVFSAKFFGKNKVAYFGATEGLNAYEGQDLIVIGTPHTNSVYLEALYLLITDKQAIEPNTWEVKKVQKNGFEFSINTYSNPSDAFLTRIQLYSLYGEVNQAIGRARTISNDCTVHYFGALPIIGATLQ